MVLKILNMNATLFFTTLCILLFTNVNALEEEVKLANAPQEINVDPRSTYNENFMALMNSPCRPEYDGFFGATSGDPVLLQYGFEVEVQPLSSIMEILNTIEDKIVDSILQSSFPEMCGLHRARKTQELRSLAHSEGHASGFRFLKFEEVEKCVPKENNVNFCGIFTGVLYVYGRHQNGDETSRLIMSYIDEVLNTSKPQELHPELTSLSSVDKFSVNGNDRKNRSTGGKVSNVGILLIIISFLIAAAIGYYIYMQRNERKIGNPSGLHDESRRTRNVVAGSEGYESSDDEFVDDDLDFEPYRDEGLSSVVPL